MTAALLRRSRAFVSEGGVSVDVITFDPRLDLPQVDATLRERGELVDGVRLRNIYHDLRHGRAPATDVAVAPATAVSGAPHEERGGGAPLRVWTAGDRTIRIEHRRADGSLAVLDERRRDHGPSRLITAFDVDGAPTGQWTDPWALYADWLDAELADEQTYAIVDSKTVAPFMQSYRRPHVTTLHAVHGSHLRDDADTRLDKVRKPVLENLHEWDAVAWLTQRQRDDVVTLVGDSGNLVVVANVLETAPGAAADERDPHHGVILANLTPRKRIDHALGIIAATRAAGVPVTAEIVGHGPEREALETRAADLGLADAVRFTGYREGAASRYQDASWTLNTSVSEGAPLTLLEAMARGCVPIAYDIRYGPADTIVDGHNGFLVADGDTIAAASALARLSSLPGAQLRALRAAARETALHHSGADVVAQWAAVQRDARRRHEHRAAVQPTVSRVQVRRRGDRLHVRAVVADVPRGSRLWVQLFATKDRAPVRVPLRRLGRTASGRLTREQTATLPRKTIATRIIVATPDAQVAVDTGEQRVDPRSLRRRAADRLRRTLRRAR